MKIFWISLIVAFLSIAGCNIKPPASAATPTSAAAAGKAGKLGKLVVSPDNTAVNARDRKNDALTAADQSDKSADIAVTQHIRQSIVADKNLSTDAKNVKIITIDGAVTLRGPVRDAFEKQLIEKAAIKVAGKHNVRDQLEGAGS